MKLVVTDRNRVSSILSRRPVFFAHGTKRSEAKESHGENDQDLCPRLADAPSYYLEYNNFQNFGNFNFGERRGGGIGRGVETRDGDMVRGKEEER